MYKKPSAVWVESKIIDDKIDPNYNNALYIECLDDRYRKLDCEIKQNGEIIDELTDYTANGSFGWLKQNVVYSDDTGVPFIRIKNITEDGFDFGDLVYINTESYDKLKKSKLNGGELLFSKTGSVGTTLVVPSNINKMSLADNIFKVIYKPNIDTYYIDAFFKSYYGKLWVKRLSQGGVQQTIIKNSFREIKIPIPSPEIQKYIGDKVRKAEELREEAKKLKKEAEEIIYKKLGNIVLEDEKNYTANYIREEDIFERIDSEYYKEKYFRLQKQLKSKGFSLKTLDELCDSNIFNGRTYKTTNKKRKYMNIGVGELGDWFILANGDKYIDENINTNYLLDRYSIIWGNSAHLAKYIGEKVNINLETNSYVPTTEITCIKPNLDKINPYYLFLYMKSNWGYYQVQRTVKGMTAHSYPEDVSKIIVPILDFSFEELNVMKSAVELGYRYTKESKQLVQEAKQDVEDLIEGNFDMSKIKAHS